MRLLVALLMAMGMFGTAAGVGRWLVTEDPPQRAHAIVILGGGVHFVPPRAPNSTGRSWLQRFGLPKQSHRAKIKMLDSLEVGHIPEFEFARRVLVQLGVPAAAVRVLQPAVVYTADEIRAILDAMSSYPESRVIVITSKVHTRRERTIWRLLGGRPEALVVRFSRNDPYHPGRWWSNTRDVLATMREVGGLLNAWLGFPLRPEERWLARRHHWENLPNSERSPHSTVRSFGIRSFGSGRFDRIAAKLEGLAFLLAASAGRPVQTPARGENG